MLDPGKTNREGRINFVIYWANYIKNNSDEKWSKQQDFLISSQIENAQNIELTPKQYLKIKGEWCNRGQI